MSRLEFWCLGMLAGILIGSGTSLRYFQNNHKDLSKDPKYATLEALDSFLKKEYYDQETLLSGEKKMMQEAIKGYINGLWDPHTLFLDPEELSGIQEELEGEGHIEGIGAVVSKKDYYVQIEEIVKGSPAFDAGLQPLDRILMIGTGETRELTTSEAVQKIRGPKWSQVELFIERVNGSGTQEYLHKEVLRDTIDIPSAKGKILIQSGVKIWLLEISIFWDQTDKLTNRAISEFIENKVQGIILDLRGNGGGLVNSVVDIAGHFIEPGKFVVQHKYRNYQEAAFLTKGYGELQSFPLVVLIDGLSASASEILTLAVKKYLSATIIGTRSFGKGTIQTFQDFGDKGALKFTVGKRFWAQGTNIDKVGITPDIEIPFDTTGYVNNKVDNQLQAAKEILYQKIKK